MRRIAPALVRETDVLSVMAAPLLRKDGVRRRRLQALLRAQAGAPALSSRVAAPADGNRWRMKPPSIAGRRPLPALAPLSWHASFRFGRQRPGLYRSSHVHPEVQFGSARVHRHCPLHDRQSPPGGRHRSERAVRAAQPSRARAPCRADAGGGGGDRRRLLRAAAQGHAGADRRARSGHPCGAGRRCSTCTCSSSSWATPPATAPMRSTSPRSG